MTILLISVAASATTVNAHSENDPFSTDLLAGQTEDVGDVLVWNDEDTLYIKYLITEDNRILTEIHAHVGETLADFPLAGKQMNPVPGAFDYIETFEVSEEVTEWIVEVDLGNWAEGTELMVAAHAVVMDITCYKTAVLYGIERYTGDVYGIDVLAGTSWLEFTIPTPPRANGASPNGLAYNPSNGYFYYTDYQLGTTPDSLYFWDGTLQTVAGQVTGTVACADIYDGKYYYISSGTDDLFEVVFDTNGIISTNTKLADISDNVHRWTFDGDIAVKDGVVYGWGRCGVSGHGFEYFTYDLSGGTFSFIKPSYQASLQLAFGSDGILYGHRSGTGGLFYEVNLETAAVTLIEPTPDPANQYTDCSSGEICMPTTQTAWGDGTRFTTKGNWATYFTYTVQGWQLLETMTVPATTATPTTSTKELENGVEYKIQVEGTYYFRNYGNTQGYLADAEWVERYDAYGTGWTKGDSSPYSAPYNGLDLCMDTTINTDWGEFNEDHIYSILYTGTGNPLNLFIKDSAYGDNSGSLTVKIYYWG